MHYLKIRKAPRLLVIKMICRIQSRICKCSAMLKLWFL